METMENPIAGSGASAQSLRLPSIKNTPVPGFLAKAAFVTALIGCVLAIGSGQMTLHMTGHILVMNIAAPAFAWLLQMKGGRTSYPIGTGRRLLVATGLQLAVFLLWHSPPVMMLSMHSLALRLVLLGVLFGVSVWFWRSAFDAIRQGRLEVIPALLVTGKLVCLVAVLLVFAPRMIYPGMAGMTNALGDQQLAGLLMLTACPLTYVGASIFVVADWFARLSSRPADAGA